MKEGFISLIGFPDTKSRDIVDKPMKLITYNIFLMERSFHCRRCRSANNYTLSYYNVCYGCNLAPILFFSTAVTIYSHNFI